jgi:hypothetical protein
MASKMARREMPLGECDTMQNVHMRMSSCGIAFQAYGSSDGTDSEMNGSDSEADTDMSDFISDDGSFRDHTSAHDCTFEEASE